MLLMHISAGVETETLGLGHYPGTCLLQLLPEQSSRIQQVKATTGAQAETKPHHGRYRLKGTLDPGYTSLDHGG